ncbi:MAG: hypothetical protein E7157_03375 [Lactobacillales bacterium]|nr:hypothetical protein [Lactobacillales bacterium]
MKDIEKQKINDKIKIFESITLLATANPEIIKNEIHSEININLSPIQIQSLTKKINIYKSVLLLLTKGCFIQEIANELGLSTSCIQRYLNSSIIEEELGENIKVEVQERLEKNINKGRKKGGEEYAVNNEAAKGEDGKFIGSYPKVI